MNSNDAKTRYNRVILKVNIFSKSSKKQPFSNLFQLIWNLSIDKKVVLMAEFGFVRWRGSERASESVAAAGQRIGGSSICYLM